MENLASCVYQVRNADGLIIPVCDSDLKSFVDQPFASPEEAYNFYAYYGYTSGFDVRKGTMKKGKHDQIVLQYSMCIREGTHHADIDESTGSNTQKKQRCRKPSTRAACKARLQIKWDIGGGYVVSGFNEGHTHDVVLPECRHLMKYNRNIDHAHHLILLKCAKANIGPMRSFRVFKELVGSYEGIGCTSTDFKNLAYELNSYAYGADAQILLDKFIHEREFGKGFKCEFELDEHQKLKRLFWADAVGIENYNIFGDSISFAATYSTNRYNMIFAPFTGKDNHGGCVTFAAGLLTREDVDSYSWLIKKFVDCMGKPPLMLITDQDPSLKISVADVMPNTRHRYCMWHIMTKVAKKFPISLRDNAELTSRLYEVAWSEIDEPEEFESNWNEVISEFGLTEHKWLAEMYEKRSSWISAFFRDLRMSGLFRTTSMSESENSFFKKYFNPNANLASFYIHYGSAMQAQRRGYKQSCMADETTLCRLKTHTPMERHASKIYTKKIFLDVQIEIDEAVKRCCIKSMETLNDHNRYEIDDRSNGVFNVVNHLIKDNIACSCKKFIKIGLICRYMFKVMHNLDLQVIPDKYIIRRWLKESRPALDPVGNSDLCNQELYSEAFRCIGIADANPQLSESLLAELKKWSDVHSEPVGGSSSAKGKEKMFEMFYGAKKPTNISAHPPDLIFNKGCGKRLKSTFEKEMEKANKPKRRCKKCKRLVRHDSRNCDKVVEEDSDDDVYNE